MANKKTSSPEKILSFLLMFIIGLAGFSLVGAIILTTLITLGIIPSI